jgi:hypothetical protein
MARPSTDNNKRRNNNGRQQQGVMFLPKYEYVDVYKYIEAGLG